MNKKKIDLAMGFKSEKEIHGYLENTFGKLKDTNEVYGKHFEFDKFNDNFFIELKTRRIRHKQYPTLMFGKNKYNKAEELLKANPQLRIFYLWRCYDGVYYWEHNSSPYEEMISGRRDRGCIEEDMCIHIKTEHLNNLDNLII